MPIALQHEARKGTEDAQKANAPGRSSSGRVATAADFKRLSELLVAAPIDLTAISGEIRCHPDLEALVLRLGLSLLLSPDEPLSTIEEAVVVLGASRLRILIELWSSGCAIPADPPLPNNTLPASHYSAATTPEMRYLLSFLRSVGFESPENTFSGPRLAAWASKIPPDQMFALTDLFMRDFFSLLPVIQPGIREAAPPHPRP